MAISRTRLLMMGVGDAALGHHLTCRTRVLSSRMSVGDPGFLSALKSIGGAALSFVPGGGAIQRGLSVTGSLLSKRRTAPMMSRLPGVPTAMAPQPTVFNRILNRLPNITPTQARSAGLGVAASALGALGIGHVLGAAAPTAVHGMRMPGRRHRRMRVTNIKALGRSTRRLAGFHKLSQHVEQQLSHLVRRRTRTRHAFGK